MQQRAYSSKYAEQKIDKKSTCYIVPFVGNSLQVKLFYGNINQSTDYLGKVRDWGNVGRGRQDGLKPA